MDHPVEGGTHLLVDAAALDACHGLEDAPPGDGRLADGRQDVVTRHAGLLFDEADVALGVVLRRRCPVEDDLREGVPAAPAVFPEDEDGGAVAIIEVLELHEGPVGLWCAHPLPPVASAPDVQGVAKPHPPPLPLWAGERFVSWTNGGTLS